VIAPWRQQPPPPPPAPPTGPLATRAQAQLALLTDLLAQFLPRPAAAQTPLERVRLQTLQQMVSPLLSSLTQGWDDERATAAGNLLRLIGARQAQLDADWPQAPVDVPPVIAEGAA